MGKIAAEKTEKGIEKDVLHKKLGLLNFGNRSAKPVKSMVYRLWDKTVNI